MSTAFDDTLRQLAFIHGLLRAGLICCVSAITLTLPRRTAGVRCWNGGVHRYGKADADELSRDTALQLLEEDARFHATVLEGKAYVDRGEFIEEEEEMDAARRRRPTEHQRPESNGHFLPVADC